MLSGCVTRKVMATLKSLDLVRNASDVSQYAVVVPKVKEVLK